MITSVSTCISGPVQATAWWWNAQQTRSLGDEFERVIRKWNGVRLLGMWDENKNVQTHHTLPVLTAETGYDFFLVP